MTLHWCISQIRVILMLLSLFVWYRYMKNTENLKVHEYTVTSKCHFFKPLKCAVTFGTSLIIALFSVSSCLVFQQLNLSSKHLTSLPMFSSSCPFKLINHIFSCLFHKHHGLITLSRGWNWFLFPDFFRIFLNCGLWNMMGLPSSHLDHTSNPYKLTYKTKKLK